MGQVVRPYARLSMPFIIHPALAVGALRRAEQSPAPTHDRRCPLSFIRPRRWVPCGGRSRASDTLRRMSSWWSQCPWGKPRPYERLSLPCAMQPGLAVIAAGVGGTHSASDTPRSMSGMWSQCPWGSPALRRVLTPVAVYPTPVGNRRPTRAIRESPLRCFLPAVGFSVGADASAARLPVGGVPKGRVVADGHGIP